MVGAGILIFRALILNPRPVGIQLTYLDLWKPKNIFIKYLFKIIKNILGQMTNSLVIAGKTCGEYPLSQTTPGRSIMENKRRVMNPIRIM